MSINSNNILNVLSKALGEYTTRSNGTEAIFFCPKCNHYKKKLNINLIGDAYNRYKYHCWVCNFKGNSLSKLLSQINKPQYIDELINIIGVAKSNSTYVAKQEIKDTNIVSLPAEFIPLSKPNNTPEYKNALNYILNRKLSMYDIIKHNVGYCEYGKYKNRIIIPSYDNTYKLNFFTARAYYKDINMKYINPNVSKDIIGFDSFINWTESINIVEGPFDALAIKINTIPLFGKLISQKLKNKIIMNKVSRINLILDNDALKEAHTQAQDLINYGVSVHLVRLDNKDPSIIGFKDMQKIISASSPLKFSDIMKFKLFE